MKARKRRRETVKALYVDEQGASIHQKWKRLRILKEGQLVTEARLKDIERLIVFGPVDFTTRALHALLDEGIQTHFFSVDGRYRGYLAAPDGKNVLLRREQYRRADDPDFKLQIAKIILDAKLSNCRYVLLRYARNHPESDVRGVADELKEAATRLSSQQDVKSCLGIEGTAARSYFAALGTMVRPEFAFRERTRRPPRDPANALLSFGYAMVMSELAGALASVGLDPYVGFIHTTEYGRPALALDVLEEFRPLIADRIAIRLINYQMVTLADFEYQEDGGVLLNEGGRARYLDAYHKLMDLEVQNRSGEGVISFRKALHQQARRMRDAVLGKAVYNPYTPR